MRWLLCAIVQHWQAGGGANKVSVVAWKKSHTQLAELVLAVMQRGSSSNHHWQALAVLGLAGRLNVQPHKATLAERWHVLFAAGW